METLGERLRHLREMKGLSQKEVADYLKITEGAYGNYETGRREPNLEMLRLLLVFYNVSAEYLFGQVEYPYAPSPFLEEEELIMYKLLPDPIHSLIHDTIINEYRKLKEDA